jgi:hypothetical protein
MKVYQADHVEAVVLEGSFQKWAGAVAQVLEVRVRHQGARDRVLALISKQALLDRAQVAALQPVAVQSPDEGQ